MNPLRALGGWAGAVLFMLGAHGAFAQMMESFEYGVPPPGWTKTNLLGGNGWYQLPVGVMPLPGWGNGTSSVPATANSGSQTAYCSWTTGGGAGEGYHNDQWLISPRLTGLTATSTVSYWLRFAFTNFPDTVYFRVSTNGTVPANFTFVACTNIFARASYTNQFPPWSNIVVNVGSLGIPAGTPIWVAVQEYEWDNTHNAAAIQLDVVSSDLTAPPQPRTSQTSLTFTAYYDGSHPAAQTFSLQSVGSSGMTYSNQVTFGAGPTNWLAVGGAMSGTLPFQQSQSFTAAVSVAGLDLGTYYATNVITVPGATNSPIRVPITFNVIQRPQTISFPNPGAQKTTNQVGLRGTSSSGLPVTFSVFSGPGSVVGATNLSFTGEGTVRVVGWQLGNVYYDVAPCITNSITVTKAVPGFVFTNVSYVYDGSPHGVTVSTVPEGLTVETTYNGSPSLPVSIGSYAVASVVNDTMYAGTGTVTFAITRMPQTVTFPDPGAQWTTNRVGLSATASSGLPVTFAVASGPGSISGATNLSFSGAGTVSVVASQAGDADWLPSAATNSVEVTKAVAAVTLESLSQTHDGTGKSATAATVPAGLAVDFTYDGSPSAPVNVGSYAVTGVVNDAMYQGTNVDVLVIGKGTATVTLTNLVHRYDGTPRNAAAVTVPAGLTVNFTYDGSTNAPVVRGSYAVTGTVDDVNWQGSATGLLLIDMGAATVTLTNLIQAYDGTPKQAAAITVPEGLAVDLTCDGETNWPVEVGSYAVTGTVNDADWAGSSTGTLTIIQGAATVALDDLSHTYDGAAKWATATTVPTGLVVDLTYDGGTNRPVEVGSYAVTGTVNDVNWQGVATGTLVIAKASATVTLGDLSHVYDGAAKSATATTAPTGLVVDLTYEGETNGPVAAGSYAVTGTVNDVNWQGEGTGTLVIAKAAATVTLSDLLHVYDGTVKSVTATSDPAGLTIELTYDGETNAPMNAGSYAVTGMVNEVNWQGSSTGTLVIAKAAATVTLGDLSHVYDGTVKSVTATSDPAGLAIELTYDGSTNVPVNAGSYAVTGMVNEVNWQGFSTGTLVLARANQSLSFDAISNPFWTNVLGLVATASSGLDVAFSVESGPASLSGNTNLSFSGYGEVRIVASQAGNTNWNSASSVTNAFNVLGPEFILLGSNGAVVAHSNATTIVDGTDLGEIIVGQGTLTNTFSLTNNGTAALTISDIATNGSTAFTILNPPSVISVSSVVQFSVVFTPQGGRQDASFTFTHNATNAPFIFNVTAMGLGGGIELETNALSFAGTYAGTNPASQTVAMTNVGVSGFTYTNVITYSAGASGWLSAVPSSGTLAMGGAATLTNHIDLTGVNAGTHTAMVAVTAGDATNSPQSYAVTLVVAQAPQGITFPNPGAQLTTNVTALSATSTSGLAVAFAVLSGPGTLSAGTNVTYSADGTVEIVASQAGNSNWLAAASVTQSFAVAKTPQAALTFAPATPQTFDTTNVLSITGGSGTGEVSYAVTAGRGEIVGTNGLHATAGTGEVTVVVTKATDAMYLSTAATAMVAYAKAYGSVFLQDLAQTYDGAARTITATTMPAGLTVQFTYDGNGWAPTNAGTYAVTGTLVDAEFQATTNGSLVVGKATAQVMLTNLNHVADGIPKHAQAITVPASLEVEFTYDGSDAAPAAPGVYAVTGTVSEANYEGATNGLLTIIHAPASVGDTVWLDENWDGVQNTGEAGIPNVRMELLTNGTPVAETRTDTAGQYLFSGLQPGFYTVRVDTNTLEGTLSENLTHDPDGTTNHQSTVELNAGDAVRTLDFGYNWSLTNTVLGAIGDRVWVDADRNGVQNSGEPGLADVTLGLFIDANATGAYTTQVATATTDASGQYIFPALYAGAYVVRVDTNTLPAGFVQTGDPDYFGISLPVDRRDHQTTAPVLLAPAGVFVNADFGYAFVQGSSIGGVIYLDLNASGEWAAGKPGLLGVTVTLLNAASNAVASALTDADGAYRFTGLPVGIFTVWVSDSENILNRRTQTGGPNGILSRRSTVIANGSSSYLNQDFGFAPERQAPGLGLIGNTVFLDRDGDGGAPQEGEGMQGMTVDLYDSTGTNRVATTATDADGRYYFGGLAAATYEVAVDTNTLAFGAAGWSNTVSPVRPVVVGAGEVRLDQNFGYVGLLDNTIEGILWRDNNANGLIDADEPDRFGDVKVILRMTNGVSMGYTFTGADGVYRFTGLPDGIYGIEVLDLHNVMFGYLSSPMANPTRRRGVTVQYANIVVGGGMTNSTGNVGFYLPYAELGNYVWRDINGNGLQDGGEPGLASVQISLEIEYPAGNPVILQSTTGTNGRYRISNLLLDPRYAESTTNEPSVTGLPRFRVWVDTGQPVLVAANYRPTLIGAGGGTNDSRDPAGLFVPMHKGDVAANYDYGFNGDPLLAVIGHVEAFTRGGRTVVRWETTESFGTVGFWLERKTGEEWVRISPDLIPCPLFTSSTVVYEETDPGALAGSTYLYRLVELENQGGLRLYGPYELKVDGPDPVRPSWDDGYRGLGDGWRRLEWFGDYVPMGTDGWIWHNKHGFFYVAPDGAPEGLWLYAPDMGWLWTARTIYPFLFRAEDASWIWFNGSSEPRWFFNLAARQWECLP